MRSWSVHRSWDMDKSKLLDQSGALGEDRLLLAKVLDLSLIHISSTGGGPD